MRLLIPALCVALLSGCGNSDDKKEKEDAVTVTEFAAGYHFAHPDAVSTLPDTLHEISGNIVLDASTTACIQDENGILFFYDFVNNRISKQFTFGPNGDYEDLARVGKSMYVLRSDGVLLRIPDFEKQTRVDSAFVTFVPADNSEGLYYEKNTNQLWIACKSSDDQSASDKDRRSIYAYDLAKRELVPKPVYSFDVDSINYIAKQEELKIESKSTKKKDKRQKPPIRFRTSGIAIHPITGKLFLLSATDHMLFIFGKSNLPEQIIQLDPVLCNKPEGIDFLPNGDLLISNEAQGKKPTLLRFHYEQ